MTTAVSLGFQRLMEPKRLSPGFDTLLQRCISTRGGISLHLRAGEVVVDVTSGPPTGIAVSGRWRSSSLQGTPEGAGALLLLPFVFLIEGLQLRHDQIYTLGRADRTLADFFMRNLFYAACRGAPFSLRTLDDSAASGELKAARDLARSYGWISKALLKDPLLDRPNAPELILASAHMPLAGMGTPLLQAGAMALRRCAAAEAESGALPLSELMQLRAQVLKLYA
jgi:hypothetical protein